MAELVHISLAGRVAIRLRDQDSIELALGPRARLALAYLVAERSHPVTASALADAIWGTDLPLTWRDALRGIIARVRAELAAVGLDGPTVLTSGPSGYQIRLPAGATVDVEVARAAVELAIARCETQPERAVVEARHALDVLQGEFAGGGDGAWMEQRQEELSELRVRALETLSLAATKSGDFDTGLWAAEKAVTLAPLRESAHVCAMGAHARAGNKASALRAYERCRQFLAEELGALPAPETEAAYVALLGTEANDGGDHPGTTRHRRIAPGNVPSPVTLFVGRRRERALIEELLSCGRLVTLTGPGGVGKSRLAIEVARDMRDVQRDGVWLVELAGISDARLLPEHIMSVLEIPEVPGAGAAQSLIAQLATRQTLLLLDNCEHVLSECASLVHALLSGGPGIQIMATSREPLGVSGEIAWVLAPLPSDDAVSLFVDRARAAAPVVEVADSPAVVTICERLDGLPLAIELAAARMRSMTATDIADRLADRFRFLAGGPRTSPARHQTLQATLDWSYEALTERERRLFERVAVFAGAFTVEAAQALGGEDAYVTLDTLWRLVDKSLLVADRGGSHSRYRLLETTRQYGYDALVRSGDETEVRRAQLSWAAELAEAAETGFEGPDQLAWLRVLDSELDNIRGALDWASLHATDANGPRLASALWRYWEIRGLLGEGRSRLSAALASPIPSAMRAKICNAAAVLAQGQGDGPAAQVLYGEALELRRELGDERGMAASLNGLGNVAVGRGDFERAREFFEENLATSRRLGDVRLLAASLMNLGVVVHLLVSLGRDGGPEAVDLAHGLYLESLAKYRELGDRRAVAQALENLGAVAPLRDDHSGAHAFLEESLALRRELDDRSGIAASTRFLGHLALKRQEYEAARLLHEECLAIEEALGNELLMLADLTSLAEIAAGEGNHAEACRLIERAVGMSGQLGDGEYVARLRLKLEDMRTSS